MDWFQSELQVNGAPIVVLIHGLCGSTESPYIQHCADCFLKCHYRVASFVARGCGGLNLTTPEGFTAARYSDLAYSLDRIRLSQPDSKIYCVGFSLGAGILLNFLGHSGDNALVTAAVAISPSWNFLIETPYFNWWSKYHLIG